MPLAAVVGKDTANVADTFVLFSFGVVVGQHIVIEFGVTGVSNENRSAVFVNECAVGGDFLLVDEFEFAVGALKVDVVEADELSLPFAESGSVGFEAGDCGGDSVDFRRCGQVVKFGVCLEEFEGHESCFPCVAIDFGESELLQAVVFAEIHVGQVDDDFLADSVVVIQRVGVD